MLRTSCTPSPSSLPCYKKGEREFYTIGLGIYSAMTYGGYNIGHTSSLSREDTLMRLPASSRG